MRRLLIALMSSLAAVALAAVVASAGAAAPLPNEIVGYAVTPSGTWLDPDTLQFHRSYTVTVSFSHRGPTEARVTETAADETGIDSDHTWFRGKGTETFRGSVAGGLVGQPVTFELLLYVRGAHHALQVADSMTVGPCSD